MHAGKLMIIILFQNLFFFKSIKLSIDELPQEVLNSIFFNSENVQFPILFQFLSCKDFQLYFLFVDEFY